MEIPSFNGSRYLLVFVDDYSRKVFGYFLKSKDVVSKIFVDFKNLVENQTNTKIKILRTNNGTEFVNGENIKSSWNYPPNNSAIYP